MPNLIELRGLPAAGKTRYARQRVDIDGNTVRLNRDDLRAMCFNSKYTPQREKYIKRAEKVLAQLAKEMGYNCIIDDTNVIRQEVWTNFARENDFEYKLKDFTDVDIDTLHTRNDARSNSVPPCVINQLTLKGGLLPDLKDDQKVIFVDIDGTLSNLDHRLHYIQQEEKDWDSFFDSVIGDSVREPIRDWVNNLYDAGYYILVVTGRSGTTFKDTERWLLLHARLKYHFLVSRGVDDRRPDDQVKEGFLKAFDNHYGKDRIEFVIDDRPRVVEMWKKNGLKVYPVSDRDGEF